jgi:hypothetical protein
MFAGDEQPNSVRLKAHCENMFHKQSCTSRRMPHTEISLALTTRDAFVDYGCDVCSKVIKPCTPVFYHARNTSSGCDLCAQCFENMSDHIRLVSSHGRYCDLCQGSQDDDFNHIGTEYDGIDACNQCICHFKDIFSPITAAGNLNLHTNERDLTFVCKLPSEYSIPNKLKNRISAEGNDEYIEMIESLVRPPSYDFNVMEWTLIGDTASVPGLDAHCTFALRCVEVEGRNQVASVVFDNHGRVAMNVVYDNVADFLRDESEWLAGKGTAEDTDREEETVRQTFTRDGCCDDDAIAAATGSFAVYKRLKCNLSMYYG